MKKGIWILLAITVLTISGVAVYRPALSRFFYADQVIYFAEMEGKIPLSKHLDYGVTKKYFKGDDILYRPLAGLVLAVENWLFSYHYVGWNVFNLCVHILVGVGLFWWISQTQPSWFALLFALLFVVMRPADGLVTYNHLGCYLVAWVMILLTWIAGQRVLADESCWSWAMFLISATVSLLFYELAFAFYLAGGTYLLFKQGRGKFPVRTAVLLTLPLLVFGSLYYFHCRRAGMVNTIYQDGASATAVISSARILRLPMLVLRHLKYHSTAILMPGMLAHLAFPSGGVVEDIVPLYRPAANKVVLGLLLAAVIGFRGAFKWSHVRKQLSLLGTLVAALFGCACIISIGRDYMRPWYSYGFCLGSVLLVCTVLNFSMLVMWQRILGSLSLLGLILVHATLTYSVNRDIHNANVLANLFHSEVVSAIEAHRTEPDFSFSTDLPPEIDPVTPLRIGYGSEGVSSCPIRPTKQSQMVYYQYYKETDAKIVIRMNP